MPAELTLNNHVTMPALGLGVFQSTPEQTAEGSSATTAATAARSRPPTRMRCVLASS